MRILVLFALVAAASAITPFYCGCGGYTKTWTRIACPSFRTTFSCKSFKCDNTIDVTYPTDTCDATFVETPIAELVKAYDDKLAPKVGVFEGELKAEKDKWLLEVEEKKNTYLTDQNKIIEDHFKELTDATPSNAELYAAQEKLAKESIALNIKSIIEQATAYYDLRQKALVTRFESYLKALSKRYETCLTTRDERIKAYESKMQPKIDEYIKKFKEGMAARKTKMVDAFKKSLKAICEESTDEEINSIAAVYDAKIQDEIDAKVIDYTNKLTEYIGQLKVKYTCAYTCGACRNLCFSRRAFSCTPFKFNCRLTTKCVSLRKYKYEPRLCKYKECVCTQEVPKDPATVKEEINALIVEAVAAAKKTKEDWVKKQEVANISTLEKFEAHVLKVQAEEIAMHEKNFGDLDAYEEAFLAQRKLSHPLELASAKSSMDLRLKGMVESIKLRFDTAIKQYELSLERQRDAIVNAYDACLKKIPTGKAAYAKKIDERIAAMKLKLEETLKKYREMNVKACNTYMIAYLGEEGAKEAAVVKAAENYLAKLVEEDKAKVSKFDSHWEEQKAILLGCYSCKAKCTPCAFKPFTFCFQPCISAPTTFRYCYTKSYCAPKVYSCYGKYTRCGCW